MSIHIPYHKGQEYNFKGSNSENQNLEISDADYYLGIRIRAGLQLQGQLRGKHATGLYIQKP